jgi:metal-dependent amidase/aminoacylase/carboxypeptidase family protein
MDAKAGARAALEESRERRIALSHRIHAHPELAFDEERAAAWIGETLDAGGFAVARGAFDLPTAFVARAGSGPLHSPCARSTTRYRPSARPATTT